MDAHCGRPCLHRAVSRMWGSGRGFRNDAEILEGAGLVAMSSMRSRLRLRRLGWVAPLVVLSACFGGGNRSPAPGDAYVAPAKEEYEARLRKLVRRRLSEAEDGERSRLRGRKPHFYKEYSAYPDGDRAFELELQEMESRTSPLRGQVTARKVRSSTRVHRNREVARADSKFLRETGTETTTYELRNGKWQRVGSLFVAERTEELVDGEWVAYRRREPPVAMKAGGEKGRIGRTWDWVRFWR